MGAGGAETIMVGRCVFNGSISMQDFLIERRPYHRNCGCALHDGFKNGACQHALKKTSVSFLRRQKWTKTSSLLHIQATSKFSSPDAAASASNFVIHRLSSSLCVDETSICSDN